MALGARYRVGDIPFILKKPMGDRYLAAFTFFDGDWHCFLRTEEPGVFMRTRAWPAEAAYYGTAAAAPEDLTTEFLDLIGQRANFKSIQMHCAAFLDDLHNLSASLHKLDLIHAHGSQGASRLAATEIEYLLVVCRSIFDHLQETLQKIWKTVSLHDKSVKKRDLKPSFARMALHGDEPRTAEELASCYGLPHLVAECYPQSAPLFLRIRSFRDALVHHGKPMDYLFRCDDGFRIHRQLGPFKDLGIWDGEELTSSGLAPLFPVLAQLVHGTLEACDAFSRAIRLTIELPEPAVPGMQLFVRGYFGNTLQEAVRDARARLEAGRSIVPA